MFLVGRRSSIGLSNLSVCARIFSMIAIFGLSESNII